MFSGEIQFLTNHVIDVIYQNKFGGKIIISQNKYIIFQSKFNRRRLK